MMLWHKGEESLLSEMISWVASNHPKIAQAPTCSMLIVIVSLSKKALPNSDFTKFDFAVKNWKFSQK